MKIKIQNKKASSKTYSVFFTEGSGSGSGWLVYRSSLRTYHRYKEWGGDTENKTRKTKTNIR